MSTASANPPPDPPGATAGLSGSAEQGQQAAHATRAFRGLRGEIPRWRAVLFGVMCIVLAVGAWWLLTAGNPEERVLSPSIVPSPAETFASFPSLWFERALTRNTWASLRRVILGFGLAVVVGVPVGVLCGCFPSINAFFAPLTIMGRNIPVAALIPLTFSLFGIGEFQKIMFIFVACVAFIVMDSATAIRDVSDRYVDTAYTLGASRRQIVLKVLVPLAVPSVFNSLRVLFGLAFGYIMLAELVKFGGTSGGLGDIINTSSRRGLQTHILLVLMIIPLVALAIDRLLYWVQRELFPHQYHSRGILHAVVRAALRAWEDLKSLFIKPATLGASGCSSATAEQGQQAAHATPPSDTSG
jgi:NitT/TauT family transport system permease protein